MSHLNCLRTMPEITDEAVIEALFAQRPYEEKVLNSAIWRSLPNTRGTEHPEH